MSRWDQAQLDEYLQKRKESQVGAQLREPEPQRHPRVALDEGAQGAQAGNGRIGVHILSRRTKLLDRDNYVGGLKFIVDALRHAGLIPQDDPKSIHLTDEQEEVPEARDEGTVVTITLP